MHSVMENDKEKIDEGNIIEQSLNNGMGAFTPDMMFEKFVKDYKYTKKITGESMVRALTGYSSEYVEKNLNIPEFRRECKKRIEEKLEKMKEDGLTDKNGVISTKGVELASLVLYTQELDNIVPKGIQGERVHKKANIYGDKMNARSYKKGDRYKDVAIKKSIKTAVRRGHEKIEISDLKTFDRGSKGEVCLLYALDASGSMKGVKIGTCKRAGVALAYNAIKNKDRVGLLVFGKEIEKAVMPTKDFGVLLQSMTKLKAQNETDLALTIKRSIEMFPKEEMTKHLLLLTDSEPTRGQNPEKETLDAVALAASHGISVSLIGINLEKKGEELARKIVELGKGKLYTIRDLKDVDRIVLEDYYRLY